MRGSGMDGRAGFSRLACSLGAVVSRMLAKLDDVLSASAWRPVTSDAAEKRSFQLLNANLSLSQRHQYARHGYFDVLGSKTGARYRIHQGSRMNVEQLDADGRRVRLLCFKPAAQLAVGDIMLAQKLALELFEPEAIRVSERFLAAPPRQHYVREGSRKLALAQSRAGAETGGYPSGQCPAPKRQVPVRNDAAPNREASQLIAASHPRIQRRTPASAVRSTSNAKSYLQEH
ncbi:MAG: hypothetical protein AB7G08_10450 [Hyphomicrobiaceae bacterium]